MKAWGNKVVVQENTTRLGITGDWVEWLKDGCDPEVVEVQDEHVRSVNRQFHRETDGLSLHRNENQLAYESLGERLLEVKRPGKKGTYNSRQTTNAPILSCMI